MLKIVKLNVKNYGLDEINTDDFIEFKGDVYLFKGYDYDNYPNSKSLKRNNNPIGKRLSDGKIIELPKI